MLCFLSMVWTKNQMPWNNLEHIILLVSEKSTLKYKFIVQLTIIILPTKLMPLMKWSQILTAESNGAKVGGWLKWDCLIIELVALFCYQIYIVSALFWEAAY